MALRLCLLVSLVALAAAQTDTTTGPTTMAASTAEATTMAASTAEGTTMAASTAEGTTMAASTAEGTTMAASTAEATTMVTLPTDNPLNVAAQNLTAPVRYTRTQAESVRQEHFFCPGYQGQFINDTFGTDGSRTNRRWTVFLQYPVLAYLDSVKKIALFTQIAQVISNGGQSVTANDFCVATVYNYQVSYYRESVLVQIYIEDNSPTVEQLQTAFVSGLRSSPDGLVTDFLGKRAIVISPDTYGRTNQNVHPGAFDTQGERFAPATDPTLRAVVVGSWAGGYSIEEVFNTSAVDKAVTDSDFAENPNPIFYGLTGGDIVFIVIGTALLALLGFLMIFGFCIQPFLM